MKMGRREPNGITRMGKKQIEKIGTRMVLTGNDYFKDLSKDESRSL